MQRLLSIQTSDGQTILYPRSVLQTNCGTIANLLSESLEGTIQLPFAEQQFGPFLELLETRCLPSAESDALIALEMADYLDLRLTKSQLYLILHRLDLEEEKQADLFLKEAGYPELSLKAIHHLLQHQNELSSFVGLTQKERFEQFHDAIMTSKQLNLSRIVQLITPLAPSIGKANFAFIEDTFPDVDFNPQMISQLKYLLPIIKGLFFPDEQAPVTSPILNFLRIPAFEGRGDVGPQGLAVGVREPEEEEEESEEEEREPINWFGRLFNWSRQE